MKEYSERTLLVATEELRKGKGYLSEEKER